MADKLRFSAPLKSGTEMFEVRLESWGGFWTLRCPSFNVFKPEIEQKTSRCFSVSDKWGVVYF